MGNNYEVKVDDETLAFEVWKNGEPLPFEEFKNVEWAMQSMLAVLKRTEGEIERVKKLCMD